jgi:hypothetical protein
MIETESPGMKGLACKPSDPSANTDNATRATSQASSIDRITNQGITEVLQVDSNLMRATRLQLTEHQ